MKNTAIFPKFMFCFVVLFQSVSSYALVLDQAQNSPSTVGDGINENRWTWQEFKPSMNNLEQIDLLLQNWNVPAGINVSFELRLDSSVLWSTSFAGNSVSTSTQWFVLDTPYIELIPEETYRLCLSSSITREQMSSGINVTWWGASDTAYPRGTSSESFLDFGFQTWAVPEPAAILLLGLGGLVLLRMKKH